MKELLTQSFVALHTLINLLIVYETLTKTSVISLNMHERLGA